ncbi:hypothetical protein ACIBBE_24615 [Streptomyces sp. NPDC051644]|uniref:hypothetical protein n=1 Tax=Streptomyces sp. NPDC051644 TaxID=3365666 RepID=UPI0037AF289E
MTAPPGLTQLVSKAARFASYRTKTYDADPMITSVPGTATAVESTRLVISHVACYTGQRWLKAEAYGAVTLHQGTTRIRLEPGLNNTPRKITERQAKDLLIIARADGGGKLKRMPRSSYLSISCGLHGVIPPAATEKLIERGYIATSGEEGSTVTVSLAGHIAVAWRALKLEKVPAGQWAVSLAETLIDVFGPEPFEA